MLTPIPLADLGAALDASPKAAGIVTKTLEMAPRLLAIKGRVTGATATLRLYCYDDELGRWIPDASPAQTFDPAADAGCFQIRVTVAEIPGIYAVVQTAGAGVVQYVFRAGRA